MAIAKKTSLKKRAPAKKRAIPVAKLENDIVLWLKDNDLFYDTHVYTSAEWKKRRELYGKDASLVITTEGPLHGILNGHYDTDHAIALQEQFMEFLEKRGYWYDLGESWMVLIYPS